MKTLLCSVLLGLALSPTGWAAPGRPPISPMRYSGLCDASAAVALDGEHFVVADDERDVLQVYRRGHPDAVAALDLGRFLGTPPDKESDLEGAARIGQRIYWIASHGRNKNGKRRDERLRFFATDLDAANEAAKVTSVTTNVTQARPARLQPVGQPYARLLTDLLAAPGLQGLGLREAAERAPEASGGLNIEGLAEGAGREEGQLLIGFRNPLVQGRALVVPLDNPQALLLSGGRARFGPPVLLDLAGRGIRSIERIGSGYLIVAGPTADSGRFALYRWSGSAAAAPVELSAAPLGSLRPEALFEWPGSGRLQVLSDDGGTLQDGVACKDQPAAGRGFRSLDLDMALPR